jgi:flagellar biogenesis protein FliO
MFEALFGSEMPLAARFFIAFLVVLGLIGLTAWLVRRFGANRLGAAGVRGRQPRLAVIDAASVDGRRRLVLIRRDNTEHLLMIGGPTDVVVEPNIVRAGAAAAREVTREPVRVTLPLQPAVAEPAVQPSRPGRAAVSDEPWISPEAAATPAIAPARARTTGADSLNGLAAELSARLHTAPAMEVSAPRAAEPVRAQAALPTEQQASPQTDHNLAEMAQQLEAALRRPPAAAGHPPVTDPLAAPMTNGNGAHAAPQIKPADMRAPAREMKATREPRIENPGKALYDNLEQEMASLLGRPSGKT